jgi:hypothetical protein
MPNGGVPGLFITAEHQTQLPARKINKGRAMTVDEISEAGSVPDLVVENTGELRDLKVPLLNGRIKHPVKFVELWHW